MIHAERSIRDYASTPSLSVLVHVFVGRGFLDDQFSGMKRRDQIVALMNRAKPKGSEWCCVGILCNALQYDDQKDGWWVDAVFIETDTKTKAEIGA